MLGTQEHYDLIAMFEREYKGTERMDKEEKEWWPRGHVYQNANLNNLFLAYRRGYAFGKASQVAALPNGLAARTAEFLWRLRDAGPDCECEPGGHHCGWPELRSLADAWRAQSRGEK